MMMMMILMFMFKFKRLLNMNMDKTVPGRSAHRRSCAGLVGESDVLLGCYACPDFVSSSCSACVAHCHHSFYLSFHNLFLLLLLVPPRLLHPKCCPCITSTHITPWAGATCRLPSIHLHLCIDIYAPNMASAGFDTLQSQWALQPLRHTDNKTCKRDGFFNPLLDTTDTSTIHVWKGQNGHSLSAYFLSWSSDSVVPQDQGLAGLVFKVWIQQWKTAKKWKLERSTQLDLVISIKLTHISVLEYHHILT